jgi:hypothetical protein
MLTPGIEGLLAAKNPQRLPQPSDRWHALNLDGHPRAGVESGFTNLSRQTVDPGIEQRFSGIKLIRTLVPNVPLIVRIDQEIRAFGHNLSRPIWLRICARNEEAAQQNGVQSESLQQPAHDEPTVEPFWAEFNIRPGRQFAICYLSFVISFEPKARMTALLDDGDIISLSLRKSPPCYFSGRPNESGFHHVGTPQICPRSAGSPGRVLWEHHQVCTIYVPRSLERAFSRISCRVFSRQN